MNKYVVIYKGLPPADADPQITTAAWRSWFDDLGSAVLDAGNPFSSASVVATDGTVRGVPSPELTGYSVLAAPSGEEAAKMVKQCPGLANAPIEIYETIPFG
jgi:hypothetical protein